ncbi:hypothetical protein [Micromonospora sp. NPDC049497]|uniref:VHL beta domain-containing protein n=1 Tax=Micromonospora sp. NPDC049497 TaxID=3364273 RepID=UPI0037BB830A
MTDSPDFDDSQADTPGLRVGGWVPQPRDIHPPRPEPSASEARHRVNDAAATAPPRRPGPSTVGRRPAYAMGLAAVAIIALAVLVLALPFLQSSAPVAAPSADTAAPVAEEIAPELTPEPIRSFSPAPVSLSTRASKKPAAPTRTATPTGRTTSTPSAPSASPKPPPPPGELAPLPASREPALRSTGGGPETFIDFVNARSAPVTVYWLNYDGQRQRYAVLQPGHGYRQHTYVGHPWVVTEADGRALVCFQPTTTVAKAVVR